MAYRINTQQIRKESRLAVNSLRNLAVANARRQFEAAQRDMLNAFDVHEVTVDLKGGPDGASKVLSYGNLTSFIGLEQDPVIEIRTALEESVKFDNLPRIREQGTTIKYLWTIPWNKSEIEEKFPYPEGWASGSWLKGIEDGISGLRYYLFNRGKHTPASRSGPAIQVSRVVRGQESYQPRPYLTELFEKFKARFINR